MDEQFAELRSRWEGDREPIAELTLDQGHTKLVVLRTGGEQEGYDCHRYFQCGFGEDRRWEVSVDGQGIDHETVFRWFADPSARTCRPPEDEE